ncbi:hypothetical protein [Kitasatospora sp. NPDC094011]|uniref:hypothetical protein n=1 Tax=Kitasatospora sp. NPDC094011 TaxID=3364090 RepID=UPI0038257B92
MVYGDPAPQHPRTLGYATDDPSAPVGTRRDLPPRLRPDSTSHGRPSANRPVLLAARVDDDFFSGWLFTPAGEQRL